MKLALTIFSLLPLIALNAYCESYIVATGGNALPSKSYYSDAASFRLGLGHRFSRALSLELSYIDLGRTEVNGTPIAAEVAQDLQSLLGAPVNVDALTGEIELTGADLAIHAQTHLTPRLYIYGRLGLLAWMAEQRYTINLSVNDQPAQQSDGQSSYDDTSLSFGVGANYRFSRHWGATLEVINYAVAEIDNRHLGAGVRYFF